MIQQRLHGTIRVTLSLGLAVTLMVAHGHRLAAQVAGARPAAEPDRWARHYHQRVALFEKENAAARQVAAAKNIVLVGSSHIEGLDAGELLPGRRVVNRGIGSDRIGITERGILHRLDSSVFDCNPGFIVLENGVNDLGELWRHGTPTIDEIEACYREVVQRIRERLPDVPLLIVGLFPTRDRYADLKPMIVELNGRLQRIAADFGCPFLDVYQPFADADGLLREHYSREGLHLTEAGYRQWAKLIDEVLARYDDPDPIDSPPVLGLAARSEAGGGSARRAPKKVLTGIDALVADGFASLVGKKVGLITNPTGMTGDFRNTIDVLHAAPQVRLVALFGPEHGVRGNVDAGSAVADARDPATGVPVYSLYGKTRKPTPEMLAGLDVLVYDIQDIGARSYTFISTMAEAMEAAAENDVAFVVLDRPNPLTGNRIEGRPIQLEFKSFVGAFPIPYLYGMTCGELARMINDEGWLADGVKCRLTVIPMRGWRRDMWFDETGLPWVPTSPHVPHADAALFCAATGIMGELHVVSEGVGYTMPFELAGAPFIGDAFQFAEALNRRALPGVHFRPMYFTPYYLARLQGKECGGVQIHITNRDEVDLTAIQFHIMDVVQNLYPEQHLFGASRDGMFDKVCGTDAIRKMFLEGKPAGQIIEVWNDDRSKFMTQRSKYLLYD